MESGLPEEEKVRRVLRELRGRERSQELENDIRTLERVLEDPAFRKHLPAASRPPQPPPPVPSSSQQSAKLGEKRKSGPTSTPNTDRIREDLEAQFRSCLQPNQRLVITELDPALGPILLETAESRPRLIVVGPQDIKQRSGGAVRIGDRWLAVAAPHAHLHPNSAECSRSAEASCCSTLTLLRAEWSSISSRCVRAGVTVAVAALRESTPMVLSGEWTQVEVVRLEVGSGGLGFGIVGGTSTGVVVKTILPGSPADKDHRLRPGDHILQVGNVNTHGMTSQQVATILRQQDSIVEMIVGRPITATERPEDTAQCWTMATKAALNPSQLEEEMRERLRPIIDKETASTSANANGFVQREEKDSDKKSDDANSHQPELEQTNAPENTAEPQPETSAAQHVEPSTSQTPEDTNLSSRKSSHEAKPECSVEPETLESPTLSVRALQEMALTVFLRENWESAGRYDTIDAVLERHPTLGLGITVAGYVHRKEEIGGVFVKSLVKGSAAYKSQLVQPNDLILRVNGESLEHLSHADSVRTLVRSGQTVTLSLIRFHADSPQALCLVMLQKQETETQVIDVASSDPGLVAQWKATVASDVDIVQAVIKPDRSNPSDGGLGIALEGTVDVVEGAALCPHHYIGSIRRDGPAAGLLQAGDELLQVNHVRVYGESHVTVREALSKAVIANAPVTLVVARKAQTASMWMPSEEVNPGALPQSFPLLASAVQQFSKAKSEPCLSSSCKSKPDDDAEWQDDATKRASIRARSLEPLAGLAVWECVPVVVFLHKDSRGLGFSVADYKDPRHPTSSVVVVQSLVPGGVAQADGRIVPGDRLLAVNQHDLSCASLERAVAVLKAAPMGIVRLCIAKPVPAEERRSSGGFAGWPTLTRAERHLAKSASPTRRSRSLLRSLHSSEETVWLAGSEHFRPHLPQGSSRSPSARSARTSISGSMASMASWSPCSSRSVSPASPLRLSGSWAYDVIYLPAHLERTIKIQKGAMPLGVTVDADRDKGVNGCVIKSICGKKAVARDGRLQVGDYIVQINHENLRNATNGQARAIFKRSNLVGTHCSVVYITGGDAKIWKERFATGDTVPKTPEPNRLSPRIFPKFYRTSLMERRPSQESATEVSTSLADTTEVPSTSSPPPVELTDGERDFLTRHLSVLLDDILHNLLQAAFSEALLQLNVALATPDWSSSQPIKDSDSEKQKQLENANPAASPLTSSRDGRRTADSLLRRDSEPFSFKASSPLDSPLKSEGPSREVVARTAEAVTEAACNEAFDELRRQIRQSGPDEERIPDKTVEATTSQPPAAKSSTPDSTMKMTSPHRAALHSDSRASSSASASTSTETQARAALMRSKLWGEARTVVLNREPDKSFGISIVGGRVEVSQKGGLPGTGNTVAGIFIKSVLPNSPAGLSGAISMGDRVLRVNEVDLREASHEEAVAAIRAAENPVRFVLQSLQSFAPQQIVIDDRSHSSKLPLTSQENLQQMISSTSSSTIGSSRAEPKVEEKPAVIQEVEPSTSKEPEEGPTTPPASRPNEEAIKPDEPSVASKASIASAVSDTSIHSGHSLMRPSVSDAPLITSNLDESFVAGVSEEEDPAEGVEEDSAAALSKPPNDHEKLSRFGYTQGKISAKYGSLPGEVLFLELRGVPEAGLGLSLAECIEALPHGVLVVAAHTACPLPIRPGDELLEVNGKVLIGLSPLDASQRIITATEKDFLELLVLRRFSPLLEKKPRNGDVEHPATEAAASTAAAVHFEDEKPRRKESAPSKPLEKMRPSTEAVALSPQVPSTDTRKKSIAFERTAQIDIGKETLIEIDKEGRGLGLSIVGGADTVLGTVVIHEVYNDGAAAMDGRLRPGDQVLEVCGVSLRGLSHERAISLLRRTPPKVRLLIYRDANLQMSLLDPTQIYNIFEVELVKKHGKGLGLSIVGRKNEPGVYVSEVVRGGTADADHRLITGDQILSVNDQDVANSMQEEVAAILKAATGKVRLKIGRWKINEATDKVHAAAEAARATVSSTTPREDAVAATTATTTSAAAPAPPPPAPAASTPPSSKKSDTRDGALSPLSEEPSSGGIEVVQKASTSTVSAVSSTPKASSGGLAPPVEVSPGSVSNSPSTSISSVTKIEMLKDLKEEGSDTLLFELRKLADQQLGMGIGKRSRGILVTSLQPGSVAAEKLKVGDRILAVNALPVTDQLSAVTFVKGSGERLFLQIARPRANPHS